MPDVDLSALASGPDPVLAQPSDVRARGDQRTRRTRVLLVGSAALMVLAAAGTAVALSNGGKPDALQTANTPSPSTEVTELTFGLGPDQGPITWQAFPSVAELRAAVPGDWLSGSWDQPDGGSYSDRCTDKEYPTPTATTRSFRTVEGSQSADLAVEEYATATDASDILTRTAAALGRCPRTKQEGGWTSSAHVVRSGRDALTYVDHRSGCTEWWCHDGPNLVTLRQHGKVITEITLFRSATSTAAPAEALAATFAARTAATYGATPPITPRRDVDPVEGRSYYVAVLAFEQGSNSAQDAVAQAHAAGWSRARELPLTCLNGARTQVGSEAAHDAPTAAVFFATSDDAEGFTNAWREAFEGLAKVTVRCLS